VATWDVVVVGGGNAALCAALAAREEGASVLLLEKEPPEWRGGNSKYTRNLRCATEQYPEAELLEDLAGVTGDELDRELAAFTIAESASAPAWMERQGVRWQPALRGTLGLERTNRFFLGGGKALLNTYYRRAEEVGVEIRYSSPATSLDLPGRAVVVAAGGFEANLVVNSEGRRFHDEREDIWPKRYAIWGRLIAEQPGQLAYSLFDSRVAGTFIPPAYPAYTAPTLGELAAGFGLDPAVVERTVAEANAAGTFRVEAPPFYGYPLRPGITFTYLGVAVDRRARVLKTSGEPLTGVFAAGEVMAGSILRHGYLGGFGMTIGTVFGRIAGREAARHARSA